MASCPVSTPRLKANSVRHKGAPRADFRERTGEPEAGINPKPKARPAPRLPAERDRRLLRAAMRSTPQ